MYPAKNVDRFITDIGRWLANMAAFAPIALVLAGWISGRSLPGSVIATVMVIGLPSILFAVSLHLGKLPIALLSAGINALGALLVLLLAIWWFADLSAPSDFHPFLLVPALLLQLAIIGFWSFAARHLWRRIVGTST